VRSGLLAPRRDRERLGEVVTRFLALALALLAIGAAPAGAHTRTTPEGVPVPLLDWRACATSATPAC
jgi:hypothetical protein